MTDKNPPRSRDGRGLNERSARDKLFQWLWTYLRGWLLIVVIVLVVKAIGQAFSQVLGWLEPFFESLDSSTPSFAIAVAILIIGPWVLGWAVKRFLFGQLFERQRGVRALSQMETRLSTELRPDAARGYPVALVNSPSSTVRSIGVVGSTFREPEADRELAAVYLPKTPDPTRGSLHVLAVEDLVFTDWTLHDLVTFHLTFGSACPEPSSSDDTGEPGEDFGGDR